MNQIKVIGSQRRRIVENWFTLVSVLKLYQFDSVQAGSVRFLIDAAVKARARARERAKQRERENESEKV